MKSRSEWGDDMKGWTVTVWVDAPDDWNAERVRQEVAAIIDDADQPGLTRNTVHTPKPEKGLDDE